MSQQQVQSLMSSLRQSAPPPNPQTPESRVDPRVEFLESLASSRKSLERLIENTDDPSLKTLFGAMHFAVNKALAGIEPPVIISTLMQSLQSAMPPGGMQQPPGALPPPQAPTAQAAPPNPMMLQALQGGMGGGPPVQALGG